MSEYGADAIDAIVRRGVLLDIARLEGVEVLPETFEIAADHLSHASHIEVASGDIVLIRTGWARFFSDARQYINNLVAPGPGIEAAQWLSSRNIFAAGSDTVAFERTPSPPMSVHVHLLVESGIHIIEVLNLEELARDQIYEFIFIAVPMKIRGATGAPIRPLAFPIANGG